MTSPLAHLPALERRLVAAGFPAMSPWWRQTLERFYTSGRRQLVLRVGRRGGKSSTLCRVSVLEALYGEHVIPPGDVGVIAIVSVSRDQAGERLRTIKAILAALGIKHHPVDNGIELDGRPVAFKVFSASLAGVVGFTAIGVVADEVARWRDAESGANPAKEVLASLRPTLAGQPHARIFLSSSPMGSEDAHAEAFDLGDNAFQIVAHAATWTANPTISEIDTHALEPDDRRRLREYGAVPQSGELDAFTADLVDPCFGIPHMDPLGREIGVFDSSMGRFDAAAWGCAAWQRPFADEVPEHLWMSITRRGLVREDLLHDDDVVLHRQATPARDGRHDFIPNPRAGWRPAPRLVVHSIGALEGKFAKTTSFDQMVASAAAPAKASHAHDVIGDSYMAFALEPAFRKHGLRYTPLVWTNEAKSRGVLRLRQWFRERTIAIENTAEGKKLRAELLAFREKILPSGVVSYGARSGAHDDRVALLLNLAIADTDELLRGSPIAKDRRRHETR